MSVKLGEGIRAFLNQCAEEVGKQEEEVFSQWVYSEIVDGIESPIEQLMFIALKAVGQINGILPQPRFDQENIDVKDPARSWTIEKHPDHRIGLWILPQYKIGPYRVDFLVIYHENRPSGVYKPGVHHEQLVVECDSQQWHERTEEERRYEKMRDRYLLSMGYKVFHYTGKEIIENALRLAGEILLELTPYDEFFVSSDLDSVQRDPIDLRQDRQP